MAGRVRSLCRLSVFYAYISFGICCIFEMLNEGEIKMCSDIVVFPLDGGESKWIISLEKLFFVLPVQLINPSGFLYTSKINMKITVLVVRFFCINTS